MKTKNSSPLRVLSEEFTYLSSPIYLSPEMATNFCHVTGDIEQLHLHEEEATESFFGTRVAPGLLTTSLVIKSMWEMHKEKNLFSGYEVINLNFDSKYLKPVEIGKSIQFQWTRVSTHLKKLKGRSALVCEWKIEVLDLQKHVMAVHYWEFGYVPNPKSPVEPF